MSVAGSSSRAVTQEGRSGVEKWTPPWSASDLLCGEFWFIFMDLFAESPAHWGSSPRPCRPLIMGVSSFLRTSRPDA